MSVIDTATLTSPRARRRRLLRKRFLRRPMAVAGLLVVVSFVLVAILAPVIAARRCRPDSSRRCWQWRSPSRSG